jgi:hypothetical protein
MVNVENENTGEVNNNDNSSPENVKLNEENIETQATEKATEQDIVTEFDPDEKIISDIFDSGKTEVTTSDLVNAGFSVNRISQYSFNIGQFNLSRLLLVEPYKIDKTEN